MTKTIISHSLESDSDSSDSEQDTSYADVIERKCSTLKPSSNCEDKIAKTIRGVSSADFILAFVAHKVLSCQQVQESYHKIKSPLEFIKNEKPNDPNINNINELIIQQREINNDLHDSFLLMPVVSKTLQNKYNEFQKEGHKLTFHDDLKLDGSIQDIVHKVTILLSTKLATQSNIDFIEDLRPFIKYLTTDPIPQTTYLISQTTDPIPLNKKLCDEFTIIFSRYLKKLFIKNRIYSFPDDIAKIIKNKKKYLNQEFNLEEQNEKLECASSKYKIHKEKIHEVESEAIRYPQYNYGQAVKNADFLPQVLCYARTIKNLIKNKILSQDNYKKIDKLLPHVTEDVPVMVTIYNTLATNLFVHNIGSYADIAKENIFDTYMQYFLCRTPAEITNKKEAALYVLMQIEVIRNPSALLTNVMFLLLVKKGFKSLRHVEEEDSKYCWANIEKQLPMAMKNAVIESLYIEYNLFLHGLISGKRLFDYRQIMNKIPEDDYVQLSYRNSDILFDWICYQIKAEQILKKLNNSLHDQTTLDIEDTRYTITRDGTKITLTNKEYILCFKVSNQCSTHNMETRSMISKIPDSDNKDGNSTPPNTYYYLDSINQFPLNIFNPIIAKYSVDSTPIELDKLQGCVYICVKPRDIQKYPTPNKFDSNKNYRDNRESEEENSSQEFSTNKIPCWDLSSESVNEDVDMMGDVA